MKQIKCQLFKCIGILSLQKGDKSQVIRRYMRGGGECYTYKTVRWEDGQMRKKPPHK